jgi:hypothetical protein
MLDRQEPNGGTGDAPSGSGPGGAKLVDLAQYRDAKYSQEQEDLDNIEDALPPPGDPRRPAEIARLRALMLGETKPEEPPPLDNVIHLGPWTFTRRAPTGQDRTGPFGEIRAFPNRFPTPPPEPPPKPTAQIIPFKIPDRTQSNFNARDPADAVGEVIQFKLPDGNQPPDNGSSPTATGDAEGSADSMGDGIQAETPDGMQSSGDESSPDPTTVSTPAPAPALTPALGAPNAFTGAHTLMPVPSFAARMPRSISSLYVRPLAPNAMLPALIAATAGAQPQPFQQEPN